MHHTIELAVPPSATAWMLRELTDNPDVIGLVVSRGVSIKPEGDVIMIQVFNKGADDVLRLLERASRDAEVSAVTGEFASLIAHSQDRQVRQQCTVHRRRPLV
jgi:hypothetical protein